MDARGIRGAWTAESLARHMQAVLQGGFILAKAGDDSAYVKESIAHLRRYVEFLFSLPKKGKSK
jgi:TetR/AcrR family transcriptional repressor of nem operon